MAGETEGSGRIPTGEGLVQKRPDYYRDEIAGPGGILPSDKAQQDREEAQAAIKESRLINQPPAQEDGEAEPLLVKADEIIEPPDELGWASSEGPDESGGNEDVNQTFAAGLATGAAAYAAGRGQEHTGGGNEPPEPPHRDERKEDDPIHSASFAKVMSKSNDDTLTDEERARWVDEKNLRINEFEKFEGGLFLQEVRFTFRDIMKHSEWDKVYFRLIEYSEAKDREYKGRGERDPRLEGLIGIAMRAEANRIIVAGVDHRFRSILDRQREPWLRGKGYSKREIDGLRKISSENHIYDFATDAPEELVGVSLERPVPPPSEERPIGRRDEVVDLLSRLVQASETQTDLLRRGYGGLIQILESNAPVDPRENRMRLPPWYEMQTPEFKLMLDFMMNANYLAAIKRTNGTPDEVFGLKGSINLNSKDFERIWRRLPGFSEAMGEMVSNIFDVRNKDHFVLSERGYEILKSNQSLAEYRKELTRKIAFMIQRNAAGWARIYGEDIQNKWHVSYEDHATAAVATAYNFLFAGGAFDSGDERVKGGLNPGQAAVCSLPFRMLYQPGIRGQQKWIYEPGRPDKDEKISEAFGGFIGEHLRWNIINTPGFRKRFENGEINLIPRRLLYSLFDHESFPSSRNGGGRFSEQSLATTLLTLAEEAPVANGVKSPDKRVQLSLVEDGGDMFTSYVESAGGYAVSLFNHLTSSGDPKKILDRKAIVELLIKARKDVRMRPTALDEDFVLASLAVAASPKTGLVKGTDKTILNVDSDLYNLIASNTFLDPRIYQGMERGAKGRILKRLYYKGFNISAKRNAERNRAAGRYRDSISPSPIRKLINKLRKRS